MIIMSPGQLWVMAAALAAALAAAWKILRGAGRRLAREWRKAGATMDAAAPARPAPRPAHGVIMQVLPCGCIFYLLRIDRERCPPHAERDAERDEINRLDQQIRNMP
ncbi:MAG TPA: hypothetical protein VK586_28140 [Streptosporangiaceae bacterium]|nr:hypothetical protein [Streptosporangiaceae bacterium]